MKKVCATVFILCALVLSTGCGEDEKAARQVLETYTRELAGGDFESAYALLSDFDRGNISKELFLQWQTAVSKILKIQSFRIESKVDRFKNYEYMGAHFKKAFGFKVKRVNLQLLQNIKTSGYDSEEYMIMVAAGDDGYKIALLITQLEEKVKEYTRKIEESK